MFALLRRAAIAPALLLLALAGCEGAGSPVATLSPGSAASLLGATESGYTLVNDPLLPGVTSAFSTSALLGYSGGTLELLDHSLTVPRGALAKDALFTLTVLPTGYVEVDLLATVTTLTGVEDVGSKGFLKPVTVRLSYERATNVKDPSKLKVLRIKSLLGYTNYEVLQPLRIDAKKKVVVVELDHFSRYTLGYPN